MKNCLLLIIAAALVGGCQVPPQSKASKIEPVASGPMPPATKEAILTEANQNAQVAVHKDGQVIVTLRASQASGYEWKLAEMPDQAVLQLVSRDYVPPVAAGPNPAVPLPGTNQFVFKAVGPGTWDLHLFYSKPWSDTSSKPEIYRATVSVE